MRAVFENQIKLEQGKVLSISDERAHHLNVVRVRVNDRVLVLDGQGHKATAKVISVTKKEIQLEVVEISFSAPTNGAILFLAVPKKEAFEDILKIATECGFTEIFPLTTKYSQYVYEENDRNNKIIESAMVQSNNLYRPKIHAQMSLNDLFKKTDLKLSRSFLFTSFGENQLVDKAILPPLTNWAVFIGPEAGFSEDEEKEILSSPFAPQGIHLPMPIMRAPTAVAVSAGYVMGIR